MTVKEMVAVAKQLQASGVGYDQGQRWSFLDKPRRRIIPNRECDCSSSCGAIAWLGGYPIDLGGTFYTGNIGGRLRAVGFDEIDISRWDLAKLKANTAAGDFILGPGHIVFVITRSQWWSAEADERGKASGGKAGDQRNETKIRAPYMRSKGWSRLYRPRSVAIWQARAIAAYAAGKTVQLDQALAIVKKRAPYDGPALERFLKRWRTLDAGMPIDTDPAALVQANGHAYVVLGSALRPDGTLTLKYLRRLKLVKAALIANPGSKVLLSGGAARNGITEAVAGMTWLIGQGIDKRRVYTEEKSSSTIGNAVGSVPQLVKLGVTSYTLVSDASHLRRAQILFLAAAHKIETSQNAALPLSPMTPLGFNDYTPAPMKPTQPVTAETRLAIAKEVAALLGLTDTAK